MACIVVIEDDPASRELIVYLLEAFGHRVRASADGVSGLAGIERQPPEIVLCDLHMPGIDGFGIARRLKRDPALRHIPLVAVTALAMLGDRTRVLEAGFDEYLTKPIDPQRFVGQVEALLAGSGARSTP
jgi:CheY-like chemotaxis protein